MYVWVQAYTVISCLDAPNPVSPDSSFIVTRDMMINVLVSALEIQVFLSVNSRPPECKFKIKTKAFYVANGVIIGFELGGGKACP